MAILVTLRPTKSVTLRGTSDVTFRSDSGLVFFDEVDSSTVYLSMNGVVLEHFWEPYIISFASPQYAIDKDYGGFVKTTFGQIEFSPDLFASEWPPPKSFSIRIEYTASTEDLAITLFEGDIYLDSFDEESVSYTIYMPKYSTNLLDQGLDYDNNTVAFPKAFGTVTHVEPLHLPDYEVLGVDYPCYHLGGLGTASDAKTIESFTSDTVGAKTKVIVDSAHGWANGTTVTINGTVNFNGDHIIESASGTEFVIPVAFPTDSSEQLPLHANAFTAGGFAVYDDGVPIQENVVIIGDGRFYLTASLVGTITISGTAAQTTLEEMMTWALARLGFTSLITDNARAVSPDMNYWADSQTPLIDFMSEVCAYFTHYFYTRPGGVIVLGDMLIDNGTDTLDEYEYFTASYGALNAVKQLKSTWTSHIAVEERVDETKSARYVKDIENVVVESLYSVSTGTADSTLTNALMDSTADFVTEGVKIGHVAQNTTDNTASEIISVAATKLELKDDIFISGEEYIIGPAFPYGEEIDITPYDTSKTNISTALQNILSVLTKDIAEITLPISATLPLPGGKITFTDEVMVVDSTTWIRARALRYDFAEEEVRITGEGVIA